MAKSRKRGGEKAHRRRVQNRNKNLENMAKNQQKLFQRLMMEQVEKLRAEQSGTTEQEVSTSQSIQFNTDGFKQSENLLANQ